MEQLDLSACFGEERLDEPMTQEQFLQQTPARWAARRLRAAEIRGHSVMLVCS